MDAVGADPLDEVGAGIDRDENLQFIGIARTFLTFFDRFKFSISCDHKRHNEGEERKRDDR